MDRYVKTTKGIVDTLIKNNPHVECFHIVDGELIIEEIMGRRWSYGKILKTSNKKEDLKD